MTRSYPQRIVHRFAPGSLLKPRGVSEPRPRKDDADEDKDYLKLVRCCPCLCCGMEPSEAAHVRYASAAHGKASGLSKKPADKWCLPLCSQDHRLAKDAQHNRDEQEFWNALGINPLLACEALYAQRGDLVAMRAVCMVTIAQRDRK